MRTFEERCSVTKSLEARGGYWSGCRNYEVRTPQRVFAQLRDLYEVILADTDSDPGRVQAAYEASQEFAETAFRAYRVSGEDLLGRRIDSVFAVPLRADGNNPIYASDTDAFFPLAGSEFGVTPSVQLRAVLGVPPSVIETNFQGGTAGEAGATIFVPLFSTMIDDINPQKGNVSERNNLFRIVGQIMHQAAELAHIRLGARVLGLGGTFPKISGYGLGFKAHPEHDMSGLVTTTGHAGTVHLILETVHALRRTLTFGQQDIRAGVIGAAGSIGWSTTRTLLDSLPDIPLYVNDFRDSALSGMVSGLQSDRRLVQESDVLDVFRQSNVIVSAVTRPIDLDVLDPGKELDLQAKVIIDDSEPKAFSRDQVEARGGYLLNVVGEATGDFAALRRDGLWTGGPDNPYNFGDEAGLFDGASWGCDIERVIISWSGAYGEAVAAEVTEDNVRNIGRLCREAGVDVARFQSFNRPADIP